MGAQKGGKRSLETMTPEERSKRAKKAAAKSAEVRSKNAAAKKAAQRRLKSRLERSPSPPAER